MLEMLKRLEEDQPCDGGDGSDGGDGGASADVNSSSSIQTLEERLSGLDLGNQTKHP